MKGIGSYIDANDRSAGFKLDDAYLNEALKL
jgi:hypothetical protein